MMFLFQGQKNELPRSCLEDLRPSAPFPGTPPGDTPPCWRVTPFFTFARINKNIKKGIDQVYRDSSVYLYTADQAV